MANRTVRRLPPTPDPSTHPPVTRVQHQEFARRLFQAMQRKGWTQSDLARRVYGTTTDPGGYQVAKGRDRISVYIRGVSVPDPKNLKRLAQVLGTTPEELAPDLYTSAVDRENPAVAITAAHGHPDKVHLVVNKLVPTALAAQIFTMLSDDADANR